MRSHIYIEGAESKEDQVRCREAFRRLLEKAGFTGRLPRLSACGGRGSAFDDFKTAIATSKAGDYIALLVDSEDPVTNPENAWAHLKKRDNWDQPANTADEQVLLMTTCMETWIVADRAALEKHYGHKFQCNALPSLSDLEQRNRHDIHKALLHATRDCSNAFSKGKRSFEVLGTLSIAALLPLPSFARIVRILQNRL